MYNNIYNIPIGETHTVSQITIKNTDLLLESSFVISCSIFPGLCKIFPAELLIDFRVQ